LTLNVWFMDDGTLIGTVDDIKRALQVIVTEGPALGLHINLPKCELWWPTLNSRLDEFPPGVTRLASSGVALLGSAVGSEAFAESELSKRVDKMSVMLSTLDEFEDAQVQLALLRVCLGMPKLAYSLRTSAPEKFQGQLTRADAAITAALDVITGDPLTKPALLQAQLPIKRGGLGVRTASGTAAAAFISSCVSTRALQCQILGRDDLQAPGIGSAVAALNALSPNANAWNLASLAAEVPSQSQLLVEADKHVYLQLKEGGSLSDKARLMSCSMAHAGAFLTAVPVPWLKLASREFSTALRLRLGMQVYLQQSQLRLCPECKAVPSDACGYHSLSCSSNSDRAARHNSLRDELAATCRKATLGVVVEHRHMLADSNARPGDVTVSNWREGRTAAFDVTVASTFTAAVVEQAALRRGYAAAQAEQHKDAKAFDACSRQGFDFVPLAVEVLGGWGTIALRVFRKLAGMLSERSGRSKSVESRYIYERLSICLQRGNARMIQQRALAVVTEYDASM
jgi:hypothetical protein